MPQKEMSSSSPIDFLVQNDHRSRIGLVMERMAKILPSLKVKVWCKQPWRKTKEQGEGDIKKYLKTYVFCIYIYTLLFLCRHIIYIYMYTYIHKVHSCKVSQHSGKPNMSVVESWTMYFFDRKLQRCVFFAARKRTILLMVQKSGVR